MQELRINEVEFVYSLSDGIGTGELMLQNAGYWDIIISVFIAIGTVGAVLYALYRDIFKRPKLKIELDQITREVPGAKTHYRICVQNTRKVTAKNCILQVEELFDFKSCTSPAFYEPLPLEWKSPEIKSLQRISSEEAIAIESPQRNIDIPPKGYVKARFVAITKDNSVFLNYDVKPINGDIQVSLFKDRSIPLTQWLVEPNSRVAIRLVAYAENSNSATSYCLFKKDTKGILKLSLTTKRPKIK